MTTTGVAEGFVWSDAAGGRGLTSTRLRSIATHVFTSRHLSFRGRDAAGDRNRLAEAMGVSAGHLVGVTQVHGRSVAIVEPGRTPAATAADALVSTDPDRAIAVYVADCVPILIADRRLRAVGAIHAGWKGTAANVVRATVDVFATLGVPPTDLVAAIGPSIGPCCYQVDRPVRDAFLANDAHAASWFGSDGADHWKLDLWRANAEQLIAAGVHPAAIDVAAFCTADHLDDCYSFRRERTTGRMAAAIRLRRPQQVAEKQQPQLRTQN